MDKLPEKILNFKDFLVVDYTQQAGTPIDPDGHLAYMAKNRKKNRKYEQVEKKDTDAG
jgi:hypothetical protein